MRWVQWGVLAVDTLAPWTVAPGARDHRSLLGVRSSQNAAPSGALLTMTGVLAGNITNAANGGAGGLAYARRNFGPRPAEGG